MTHRTEDIPFIAGATVAQWQREALERIQRRQAEQQEGDCFKADPPPAVGLVNGEPNDVLSELARELQQSFAEIDFEDEGPADAAE